MSRCTEKWTFCLMGGALITLKRFLNPNTEVVGENIVLPTSKTFLMEEEKEIKQRKN